MGELKRNSHTCVKEKLMYGYLTACILEYVKVDVFDCRALGLLFKSIMN